MNAGEVKDALLGRHPAVDQFGNPSTWTCVEEWMNIDLLAVSAWASCRPFPRYARVGYEVKVSRSDYKRELQKPNKRAAAVAFCHEFYFAVPHGLLKPDEIQWVPPDWLQNDWRDPFRRPRCPGAYGYACHDGRVAAVGWYRSRRGGYLEYSHRGGAARVNGGICPTCRGEGWIVEASAVRAASPKLWIPLDVGLVVVYPDGRVVTAKKAPRRSPTMRASAVALLGPVVEQRRRDGVEFSDAQLADLIRWVSYRPDPRHVAARSR